MCLLPFVQWHIHFSQNVLLRGVCCFIISTSHSVKMPQTASAPKYLFDQFLCAFWHFVPTIYTPIVNVVQLCVVCARSTQDWASSVHILMVALANRKRYFTTGHVGYIGDIHGTESSCIQFLYEQLTHSTLILMSATLLLVTISQLYLQSRATALRISLLYIRAYQIQWTARTL